MKLKDVICKFENGHAHYRLSRIHKGKFYITHLESNQEYGGINAQKLVAVREKDATYLKKAITLFKDHLSNFKDEINSDQNREKQGSHCKSRGRKRKTLPECLSTSVDLTKTSKRRRSRKILPELKHSME
jgi:hypothetical protein